jgi:hypothetical protein
MNNLAYRGPIFVRDDDFFQGNEGQAPMPFTELRGKSSNRRVNSNIRPFDVVLVPDAAQSLIAVRREFGDEADNLSLLPRFMAGALDTGNAAGGTSSGLAQLQAMADKGMFDSAANIDQVRVNLVRMWADWEMKYNPDPLTDGDCQVVVRTTANTLYRRQALQKAFDFLDRTNNPIDQAIMGVDGRRNLLRICAEGLASELSVPLSADDLVASEAALRLKKIEEAQAQMAAAAQAQVRPQQMPRVPGALVSPGQQGGAPNPALTTGMQEMGQGAGTGMKEMPAGGITPGIQ